MFPLIFLSSVLTFSSLDVNHASSLSIYREGRFVGLFVGYNLMIDGKKIANINNNRYLNFDLSPGKHIVSIKPRGLDGLFARWKDKDVFIKAGEETVLKASASMNPLPYLKLTDVAGEQAEILKSKVTKKDASSLK